MRTRVKICGFTRPDNARLAVQLGVDAIGLVFYPPSPRFVGVEQARAIVEGLPPFLTVVGLFVDEEPARVRAILEAVRIDRLQFHGDEPPDYCAQFRVSYIKSIRMRTGTDLAQVASDYAGADALLLDVDDPAAKGGTGTRFDWSMIAPDCPLPLILAGGLDPGNAAEALRRVRPYALDVSSGVESAKGVKDPDKMAAFLKEVYQFDHAQR